jgi:hypothetical protein
LSRLEASIEKYSKEASRIKNEDSSRWIKRFKEASRTMDNLKREIAEQGMSSALDTYLQKKTSDLENSKLLMKTAHVNKINSVYQNEMENSSKVVVKAAEILQQNFLLLRSMGELDNAMVEQLQALGKLLQGERSVKFAESEAPTVPEATECLTFHNIMNLTDYGSDEVAQSPMSAKKRLNDDDELENESKKSKNQTAGEDFQFLRPKAMKSINFGAATSSSEMNVTFDMHAAGPSGPKPILSERSNRPATTPGVMKSK